MNTLSSPSPGTEVLRAIMRSFEAAEPLRPAGSAKEPRSRAVAHRHRRAASSRALLRVPHS